MSFEVVEDVDVVETCWEGLRWVRGRARARVLVLLDGIAARRTCDGLETGCRSTLAADITAACIGVDTRLLSSSSVV
jgi:hypothetical protein